MQPRCGGPLGYFLVALVVAVVATVGAHRAGAGPLRVAGEPVPWGDLHFVDTDTLLVPYATIRTPGPDELAAERARREAWLARPTEEIVDELVKPQPGEPEGLHRFRRWIARAYIDAVKTDPQRALEAGVRYVTETGVRVVDLSAGGLAERARIPVWRGLVRVQDRVSSLGGLGAGASEHVTPMVNLQVGVVAGSRYLVLWSWPGKGSPERERSGPLTVLVERDGLTVIGPLGAVRPVVWVDGERLFALVSDGDRWVPALLAIERRAGGLGTRVLRIFDRPSFGDVWGPAFPVLLPAAAQAEARLLVYRDRLRLGWLDLVTGESGRLERTRTASPLTLPAGAGVVELSGRAWLVALAGRWQLLAVRDGGGRPVLDRARELPSDGFWCGPLAATAEALLLCRDPGIRRALGRGVEAAGGSGLVELWFLRPVSGRLRRLDLPPVPFDVPREGRGAVVAVSPDGRWLAARASEREVRIRPLATLVRARD